MAPKLSAARAAVLAGVDAAWIASWQGQGTLAGLVDGSGLGTRIARAPARNAPPQFKELGA
jgi:acetylglutamate kinase